MLHGTILTLITNAHLGGEAAKMTTGVKLKVVSSNDS